jgi:hypothetical protein
VWIASCALVHERKLNQFKKFVCAGERLALNLKRMAVL